MNVSMTKSQGTEGRCPRTSRERESRVGVSEERAQVSGFSKHTKCPMWTLGPGCPRRMRPRPPWGPSLALRTRRRSSRAEPQRQRGAAVSHFPPCGGGSAERPEGREHQSTARPVASHPQRPLPSGPGKSGRGRRRSLWGGRTLPRGSAAAGGRDASAATLGRGADGGGAGGRRRRR